jgi:hypothetical protein
MRILATLGLARVLQLKGQPRSQPLLPNVSFELGGAAQKHHCLAEVLTSPAAFRKGSPYALIAFIASYSQISMLEASALQELRDSHLEASLPLSWEEY